MNPENKVSAGNCKICDCHIQDEGLSSVDPAELLKKKRDRSPSLSDPQEPKNPFENWSLFENSDEEAKPKNLDRHKKYYKLIKEAKEVEICELRIGALNKLMHHKKQLINNKIEMYRIEYENGDYEEMKKETEKKRAKVKELDKEIAEIFSKIDDDDVIDVAIGEKKVEERVAKKKDLLFEIYELEKKMADLKNEINEKIKIVNQNIIESEKFIEGDTKEMKDIAIYHEQVMKDIKNEEDGLDPREPSYHLVKFNIS